MKQVKNYSAEEIRDFYFSIAGHTLSINQVTNLKVYSGNSVYINKKKVEISEIDLQEIINAQEIYFLYAAKDGAYFSVRNQSFSTSEFGHNEYEPKSIEAFKTILEENNITITEKR